MAEGDKWGTPFVMFPQTDARVNPDAPTEIRAAFEEACTCYRTQAFTASAIMCRKTLAGVCAGHGIEERNLSASIRKMKDVGLIDERLFEWSDALRVIGNEAAHGVGFRLLKQMPRTRSSSRTQSSTTCSRTETGSSSSRNAAKVPNHVLEAVKSVHRACYTDLSRLCPV